MGRIFVFYRDVLHSITHPIHHVDVLVGTVLNTDNLAFAQMLGAH